MKTLKNLFLLSIIVLLTFSSCDEDDDAPITIVGTWKLVSATVNGIADTELIPCDLETTLNFTENIIVTTYYFDPENDAGSNCQFDDSDTGEYTINGDFITVTFDDGDSITDEIEELTATTLKIKFIDDDEVIVTYVRI